MAQKLTKNDCKKILARMEERNLEELFKRSGTVEKLLEIDVEKVFKTKIKTANLVNAMQEVLKER